MNRFPKCTKLILALFLVFSCCFCSKEKEICIDSFKEDLNSKRDSIGLIPYDANWQTTQSEGISNYWCNSSDQIKLANDTINNLGKGIYVGKCLVLEDSDSLKCVLDKEVDIFVMNYRDNKGRITNNKLFISYNFRSTQTMDTNWDYSLVQQNHNIAKNFFPKGSGLVDVKYITKLETDSILNDWGVCHPSIKRK